MPTEGSVFISHASEDAELAQRVLNLLRSGLGLRASDVFCSSAPGSRIPVGEDFVQHVREQLENAAAVVPLVTPAYLDSQPCLCELGAAWLKGVDILPLVVEPTTMSQLGFVLGGREARWLHKPDDLNDIADHLRHSLQLTGQGSTWERERTTFLGDFESQYRATVSGPRKVDMATHHQAVQDLLKVQGQVRYAGTLQPLRRFAERVRDAFYFLFTEPKTALELTLQEQAFATLTSDALESMASAFSILAEQPCRAGIKWLDEPDPDIDIEDWSVRDLIRTSTSGPGQGTDFVGANTDFRSIIELERPYYLSNDLVGDYLAGRHANSHWTPEAVERGDVTYRSALVAPVGRLTPYRGFSSVTDAAEATPGEAPELIGFLWVDATNGDAFDEARDPELMMTLAATLYPLLAAYRQRFFPPAPAGDTQKTAE